jgi:hypothetical protein
MGSRLAMSINFPTSLDTTDEIPNSRSNATVMAGNHPEDHNDLADAILALEAKVGVNSSAVTSTLDYKVSNASSANPGHSHSGAALTGVLEANITDGSLLARVASAETISGAWTFNAGKILDKGSLVYDVKAFGAVGDNATNDTVAIQAAIDAANTASGGTVFFPKGTYLSNKLTTYTAVNLIGVGPHATIVKLRDTQNTALLTTSGFVTTDTAGGIHSFRIQGIAFDGNKANQASNADSGCVQIYGYNYRISDVKIRNAESVGLYTNYETGTGAPGPNGLSMESRLDDVEVYSSGTDGIFWNGPHDSVWVGVDAHENAAKGINVGARGNALHAIGCHSWGLTQTYAWYISGTGCSLTACDAEGAVTAQIALRANDQQIQGGHVYAATGGTTGIVVENSAAGLHIDTKVSNCTTAAILFTTTGAGSRITLQVYGTSGATYSGTPATDCDLLITTSGGQLPNVGPRVMLGPWYVANAAAAQSDVYFLLCGTGPHEISMLRPGSITGVMARSSATRVAGTATIEVLKNDVATGLTAVINGTDTVFKGTTQALGTDTFVLGDVIAVKWTTDASWDPTTADFTVMVEVNY